MTSLFFWLSMFALSSGEDKTTYEDHVRPILAESCFSCHNANRARAGLDLTSYDAVIAGGSGGEIVSPGRAEDSALYQVVAHMREPKMPPRSNRLPEARLVLLKKWIDGGLLETAQSERKIAKKKSFDLLATVSKTERPEGEGPYPEHVLVEPSVVTEKASAVASLASSPWSPIVALTGQKQVLLYNTDNGDLEGVLPFDDGFPRSLSFSSDGETLVVGGGRGGKSGCAQLFSIVDGSPIAKIGEQYDTVLAADIDASGRFVAMGGVDRLLEIYDAKSGELLRREKKHTDWILAVAYSPDGVLLASGDRQGGLRIWETTSGAEFYVLQGHQGGVTDLSWRSDSNVLASSSMDGTVKLWEMHRGSEVKSFNAHGGGAVSVHFSPDNRLVTSGRDRLVRVWDASGQKLFESDRLADLAMDAVFDSKGKRIISADWQGGVQICAVGQKAPLHRLRPNPRPLEERLSTLRQALAQCDHDQKTTRSRLASIAEEVLSLEGDLSSLNSKRDPLVQSLEAAQNEERRAKAERVGREQIHAELTARETQGIQDQANWNRAIAEAQKEHAAANEAREQACSHQDSRKKLVAHLEESLAQAKEILEGSPEEPTLLRVVEESERAVDAARQAFDQAVEDEAAQVARLEQTRERETKARASLEEVESGLATLRKEVGTSQQELEEAVTAHESTQKQLTQSQDALSRLDGQISKVRASRESLLKEKAKSESSLKTMASQTATWTRRLRDGELDSLNLERAHSEQEWERLRIRHQDALISLNEARKALESLREEHRALQKELERSVETMAMRMEERDRARTKIPGAENEVRQAESEAQEREVLLNGVRQSLEECTTRLAHDEGNRALQGAIASLRQTVVHLEDDVRAGQALVDEASRSLSEAQNLASKAETALNAHREWESLAPSRLAVLVASMQEHEQEIQSRFDELALMALRVGDQSRIVESRARRYLDAYAKAER